MRTRDRAPRRNPRILFVAHLYVVGLVLASGAWIFADALKGIAAARAPVLEWARLFHHPDEAALVPYVASALAAFGWGLFLYVGLRRPAHRTLRRLRRAACARSPWMLVAVSAVQALLVVTALPLGVRTVLAAASVLACFARRPAWLPRGLGAALLPPRVLGAGLPRPRLLVRAFCVVASAAALFAVAVEPVRLATRPVRLLNEYTFLPERARAGAEERPGVLPEGIPAASAYRCGFAFENPLEYGLQSMSRGQLNHVGHILNPINEWQTGKPLDRIYFQYGLGATFAFKAVMDLAGGPSLQAYYRSLLFFVAYWIAFAAAAVVLLRDARYVLAAVGLLGVAHYMLGYHALLLAPGINPVLHFFDLPILLAALRFFRTGGPAPLALAALGAVAAAALNGFYGGMAALALLVSAGFHVLERAPDGRRARRLLTLAALVGVPLAALAAALPRTAGGSVAAQFLSGFFSWRPAPALVLLTIAWLAASYLFLLWSRERRDPAKYAVVYLFVYAQGFFVYFYWSGLENHFWPVLPYMGLHALLMLRALAGSGPWARWERPILAAAIVAIAVVGKVGVDDFVSQRNAVKRLFARWETHDWPFARARVIATADPAPIAESLAQIERYAGPDERGVSILSVFDNLLPFLAGRHSIFHHFDLQWALVTEEERARAIDVLGSARPRYLFVGREVEGDVTDPWEGCGNGMDAERAAARGRIEEIRRVLDAVSADYERIDTGPLLSVYRLRGAAR